MVNKMTGESARAGCGSFLIIQEERQIGPYSIKGDYLQIGFPEM
jgi:hypothetical protein